MDRKRDSAPGLDKSFAEQADFHGAKFVMSPPLREKRHREFLWSALRDGTISVVATDHAPFDFASQKHMGIDDFTKIPNGIPSIEDRVNLLYTHGVMTGRIDLHRFVDCASTQPARIFGLEHKGTIAPGYDADLVVYDPDYRGSISAKTHSMNTDHSAFEGWEVKGRPSVVTMRGEVKVRDGRFVGSMGTGRLMSRTLMESLKPE
jgi:dihydropyrimidinase